MATCGECAHFDKGLCVASGWLGCTDEDLAQVTVNTNACEAYTED